MEDNKETKNEEDDEDYVIDFTTSSAISKVGIKFLVLYLPIFWFSGLIVGVFWYQYMWFAINTNYLIWWIIEILCIPFSLIIQGLPIPISFSLGFSTNPMLFLNHLIPL